MYPALFSFICRLFATRRTSLSDDNLNALISRIPTARKPVAPFPPAPIPTMDLTPAKSESSQFPLFSDITEKPYNPTLHVEDRVWVLIGGWARERRLASTAALAAHLLRQHDRGHVLKDISVDEVEALLQLAKDVATRCLERMDANNRHLYQPRTVRELQLTRGLGGKIKIKSLGRRIQGTLLAFSADMADSYQLEILVEEAIDNLPVISVTIPFAEWFQGSDIVEFLDCVGSERDCSSKDASDLKETLASDMVLIDNHGV